MARQQRTTQSIETLAGYAQLLKDVKAILERGLSRAYQAVDNIRVQAYWQIGERVTREELVHQDRADYGERLIERLARDLGYSRRLMYDIVRFYKTYPIVHALHAQLSWTHYRQCIAIEDKDERDFYEIQTITNRWSSRTLQNKIRTKTYQQVKRTGHIVTSLPLKFPSPEEAFKDVYNWDFLQLSEDYSERELEENLIGQIEHVLLEFGRDFSLVGRQRKLVIDGQMHSVDLEFYHRGIPCIVLVNIKRGRFKSEYVGQMNKYLNFYNENYRYDWEKHPIGLIVCERKGKEEVHYALGGLEEHIFVAEYRVKLPDEEEIARRLQA